MSFLTLKGGPKAPNGFSVAVVQLYLNLILNFEGWIYCHSNKNTKQNSDEINKYINKRNEEMKNINSLKIILQGAELPGVTFIKQTKNELSLHKFSF